MTNDIDRSCFGGAESSHREMSYLCPFGNVYPQTSIRVCHPIGDIWQAREGSLMTKVMSLTFLLSRGGCHMKSLLSEMKYCLPFKTKIHQPGMVVLNFNPNIGKAGAGGSL